MGWLQMLSASFLLFPRLLNGNETFLFEHLAFFAAEKVSFFSRKSQHTALEADCASRTQDWESEVTAFSPALF